MDCKDQGFTLLELILVMALVGILSAVATWSGQQMAKGWQLKRAGHQLYEDLKAVQGRAEMSGSMTIGSRSLALQRWFLVFEADERSYAAYRWQDEDGNGIPVDSETDKLWERRLPGTVSFGWATGVDRRACSNVNALPGSKISFSRPGYAPCHDRPCIKFDSNGFSVTGPGAIYLYEGEQSLALSATRPGHFTVCGWNGERWR